MTLSFAERVAQLDTMEKAPTRLDLKLLANLGPESVYIFGSSGSASVWIADAILCVY